MGKRLVNALVLNGISVYGNDELGNPSLRLDNVNMNLEEGEWLFVVGVNGSGKSTLAKLLAGLQPDGIVGELYRGFAGDGSSPIVLQQPRAQLFGETPREEITFALEWQGIAAELIPERVERALKKTGLILLADEAWDRLSGGQQQLAALAASTACDTPLIVLDEVTSMLDEGNRNSILQTAQDLHKNGTAVIWVTQRLDELEPESRVIALGEGTVVYDGNGRDFLYGVTAGTGAVPISPCLRAGLRLPYMAAMALELRRLGKLNDPLPMTGSEWRKVLGNIGDGEAEHATR
ncbi:energy-coupling factor ABC transporter ATP-binding protein [Cohnella silvisoli]|uniref:ABC transporter ATP-binding protein n=1 Tax=Cohnella silvisoli TaxID=2873699 RepID=A0ABV1KVC3_9BACL|nr:ABC transporter ATP-binding protein [Cohnella silvisoli]MCD9023451.1 energy-coupling factor ABC transporter ATP-binding protein [Cohnella silvisoli]